MPKSATTCRRAALLLGAVILATAGCGQANPAGTPDPEVSATGKANPPAEGALRCGQVFTPPAGTAAAVKGEFPTNASLTDQKIAGTAELSSQTGLRGVTSPQAEVFLVQEGKIVTLPQQQDLVGMPVDLSAGKTERLPGVATLAACKAGGGQLSPGTYQIYARVVISPEGGTRVESVGGPWPVEVR